MKRGNVFDVAFAAFGAMRPTPRGSLSTVATQCLFMSRIETYFFKNYKLKIWQAPHLEALRKEHLSYIMLRIISECVALVLVEVHNQLLRVATFFPIYGDHIGFFVKSATIN